MVNILLTYLLACSGRAFLGKWRPGCHSSHPNNSVNDTKSLTRM